MEVRHRLMLDKRKAYLVEYQEQMSRTGRFKRSCPIWSTGIELVTAKLWQVGSLRRSP